MSDAENVATGEVKVAESPAKLRAAALGSCVAVILYDAEVQVGGVAHVMLPSTDQYIQGNDLLKYADQAVDHLINQAVELGARRHALTARLVGGAMIAEGVIDIGAQNIKAIDEILAYRGIETTGRKLGGRCSRSVTFDLETGTVWYSEAGKSERVL